MDSTRQLHIGIALAQTWTRPGMDGIGWELDLARRAEAAHLDFVFKPDSLFIAAGPGAGPAMPMLDPTLTLAQLAAGTERIGLVTTISTTFNHPYVIARQLQSLHWLSNGRAGWNIVTALDGQRNFGMAEMPPPAERYARAAEFTNVVRALWASHDAQGLAAIDHQGAYFSVEGPLNVPAHPSGRIPLFQAGASDEGRDFAASVADAIFASLPDMAAGVELRRDLHRRLVAQGRKASDLRLLPGFHMFLAPTRAEAEDLLHDSQAAQNPAIKRRKLSALIGADVTDWPLDRPVTAADLPSEDVALRSRTHSVLLRRTILRDRPRLAELLERPEVASSAHWVFAGTPDEAAREVVTWADAGTLDGFIALPGGSEQSLDLCLAEMIPELVAMGRFRDRYDGETLGAHLGLGNGAEAAGIRSEE